MGWLGHENEQRYSNQSTDRMTDISIIYTSTDPALALEILHLYNVSYIYVGGLERQAYAPQSSAGLNKFDQMVHAQELGLVYRAGGVSIYRVLV
jgi:uncharacterized membrane protein